MVKIGLNFVCIVFGWPFCTNSSLKTSNSEFEMLYNHWWIWLGKSLLGWIFSSDNVILNDLEEEVYCIWKFLTFINLQTFTQTWSAGTSKFFAILEPFWHWTSIQIAYLKVEKSTFWLWFCLQINQPFDMPYNSYQQYDLYLLVISTKWNNNKKSSALYRIFWQFEYQ